MSLLTAASWHLRQTTSAVPTTSAGTYTSGKEAPRTQFVALVASVGALLRSLDPKPGERIGRSSGENMLITAVVEIVTRVVFGTMAADGVHVVIGIPYLVSSMFFAVVLTAIFVTWYSSEKTLSIHSISTFRREAFYWTVVMATFALGTATGDMTAITLHLGYLSSGLLFAALIAIPAVGFWRFGLNGIFAFWFAYVMTRPLGASFADWLAVPPSRGGLGLGFGPVSVSFTGWGHVCMPCWT